MTPVLYDPRQEEERLNRLCEANMERLDDYDSLMDIAAQVEAAKRKPLAEPLCEYESAA